MHRSASVEVVTSFNRSDCYRLERQLPGGVRTRWVTAPFHGARIKRASAVVPVPLVSMACTLWEGYNLFNAAPYVLTLAILI